MKNLINPILLVFIFFVATMIVYSSFRIKRLRHKKALSSLMNKLTTLRNSWSYKNSTVPVLYGCALKIVSEIIEDTYLKERERYDILYELEELMNLHLFYRIRAIKNSKEFMETFGSLWSKGIKLIIPDESEKYLLVKKIAGVKGEAIALFWDADEHFFYAVLDSRNYILEILKSDSELIKRGAYRDSSGDFFNLAGRLIQVASLHLAKYPDRATASGLKLTLEEIEEILQSVKK